MMSTEIVGVIYILTNPSFPDYVKLGYASDLDERLAQLNKSECVPFAFRPYATYGVTAPLRDRDLHMLIDRLRPDLRSVERAYGKTRVREFYAMTPEDAYALLYGIARLSGTEDRLNLIQNAEGSFDRPSGRRRFRFELVGIPEGSEISLIDRPEIRATVLHGDRVACENASGELETGSLAAFTKLHLGVDRIGAAHKYWTHGSVRLEDLWP